MGLGVAEAAQQAVGRLFWAALLASLLFNVGGVVLAVQLVGCVAHTTGERRGGARPRV